MFVIFDVSRSRIVGSAPTCASSTTSTCSRLSPSATKISTSPASPTSPPARSTIVTTFAHGVQTRRMKPARLLQYTHRIEDVRRPLKKLEAGQTHEKSAGPLQFRGYYRL